MSLVQEIIHRQQAVIEELETGTHQFSFLVETCLLPPGSCDVQLLTGVAACGVLHLRVAELDARSDDDMEAGSTGLPTPRPMVVNRLVPPLNIDAIVPSESESDGDSGDDEDGEDDGCDDDDDVDDIGNTDEGGNPGFASYHISAQFVERDDDAAPI